MENKILEFITTVRESFDGAATIYTQGSCFHFYKILKCVFPEAEAYYDMDHVITKIGDKFYDINGEYSDTERYLPLSEYGDMPSLIKLISQSIEIE